MMKRLRLLLFALLFAFTLHAHANGQSVQFIITGDLHGQLKPLSQLAALFRKYPDAVKIDLGDLFQGEPAHDISNGEVMIDALNALKYDFIIPGNHDFELSAGQFTRSYSRFSGTLLGQWRCGKLPVFPWKIIERNKFKSIFEPGYTTKQRGWGLGLSLAKRIIEEYHNGKIFVKSSELGLGTTFRIELPTIQVEN